jgi:hypothetical protein
MTVLAAHAEFEQLARQRDTAAGVYLTLLDEQLGLLRRVATIDERIRELEFADRIAARAQDKAVRAGHLAHRPARRLSEGALATRVAALVTQLEHAITYNSADQRI